MEVGVERRFSSGFRETAIKRIPALREEFEKEMHRGCDLEFGRRFKDDTRVLQEFLSTLPKLDTHQEDRGREAWYMNFPDELKKKLWQALKAAAECDWYYSKEKQW